MSKYYWGIECIACNNLHPLKLASSDDSELVPAVPRFIIYCNLGKAELIYERSELIKYYGPQEENFQPHQLFR